LREHAGGFLPAARDQGQRPDPLAIQRERLGKRVGDEQRCARPGESAHCIGVGVDPVAEALIGNVDKGDELALEDDANHFAPLRGAQVHSGRVVAAGVQDDDRARGQARKRVAHAGEIEAVRGRVVIRIAGDLEPGVFEQGTMVFPARFRDP
jgi:hypothetical protein